MEHHQDVRIIAVPYDSGHPGLRMGAGPEHLLDNGLGAAVRPEGRGPSVTYVRHEIEPTAEVATAFELHALVSGQVRHTKFAEGGFPLVLSGNCNTAAIGAIAGAGPEGLGIVWFDAHGEFNTPETTTTGFIDGMGLAIAVGCCWKAIAKGVPGFAPVPEANVVMVWVRELDGAEQERLDASGVAVVGARLIEKQGLQALGVALDDLSTRVGRVYVHVDLDVLDAEKVGKANEFAAEGGPDAEELRAAMRIAIESGTHSPWASRVLEECGHEVLVANARKLRLIYARASERPTRSMPKEPGSPGTSGSEATLPTQTSGRREPGSYGHNPLT